MTLLVFPTVEDLLANRGIRRRSDGTFIEDSHDYGVWWRDRRRGAFRLTWLGPVGRGDESAEAGELYLLRLAPHRGEAELLCVIPAYPGTDADADVNVEAILDGWSDVCGAEGSVDWIRDRVREALEAGWARPPHMRTVGSVTPVIA